MSVDIQKLAAARDLCAVLSEAGYIAYYAGGWVRDLLLDRPSDDVDIATSAQVEEIEALFEKTVPVGIRFGAIIVIHQGHAFEVSSFRKDGPYLDGRRPVHTEVGTPEEDAFRRDFTINGMFFDPSDGMVIDEVGAKQDLHAKLIRCIGSPRHRFQEDRLRMIRAVRFAARLDFEIEEQTQQAIIEMAAKLLPAVSVERIWQEFEKITSYPNCPKAFNLLHELGLLSTIFPSLKSRSLADIQKQTQVMRRLKKEVPTIFYLAQLWPLCDELRPIIREEYIEAQKNVVPYLKCSKENLRLLEQYHKILRQMVKDPELTDTVAWCQLYAHPQTDLCLHVIGCSFTSERQNQFSTAHYQNKRHLQPFVKRLIDKTPLVSSQDLFSAGVKSGISLGKLLKLAEKISIEQQLHNKDEVIAQLKTSQYWPKDLIS